MVISNNYRCVVISAPELCRNKKFTAWLNQASRGEEGGPRSATWHRPEPTSKRAQGKDTPVGDYSDLFVWKDNGREGSDSDMPASVWNKICKLVGEDFAGIVWIKFF
jgi:hypothetical protein